MLNPIPFDNTYVRLPERFYAKQDAATVSKPQLLRANTALAHELGIDPAWLETTEALDIFSGNRSAKGSEPLAQAYAGHQFGGFSPRGTEFSETTSRSACRVDSALHDPSFARGSYPDFRRCRLSGPRSQP